MLGFRYFVKMVKEGKGACVCVRRFVYGVKGVDDAKNHEAGLGLKEEGRRP